MARVWFVTGSSRGLGLAVIKAALEAGDSIAASARKPEQLNHLVEKYGSDRVLPLKLDVSNYEQSQAAIKEAVKKFGRLDIVLNNAGYVHCASIEDMSIEIFREQFETNFFGIVNVTKAVLPILREQGHGHIMQVSTVGDRLGTPGMGSYQSAKWAVAGLTAVLGTEVTPLGIKLTLLEPGGMKTDWAGSSATWPKCSPPYEQTVGQWHKTRDYILNETSEVDDVAKVIFHVSKLDEPPARLLLTPSAIPYAQAVADKLAKSDEKYRELTRLNI